MLLWESESEPESEGEFLQWREGRGMRRGNEGRKRERKEKLWSGEVRLVEKEIFGRDGWVL